MKGLIRYCELCNSGVLNYKQIRYCSSECQKLANRRKDMICKLCEQKYYPSNAVNKGYCSVQCWLSYKHSNKLGTTRGQKLSYEQKTKLMEGARRFQTKNGSWNKGLKGYKAGSQHYNWGKTSDFMRGENNPNWKGGITNATLSKKRSTRYYVWRRHVFDKDNYTCQVCSQYGGYLHADHIKPWAKYPKLRYDLSNGQTLCRSCHYFKTFNRHLPEGNAWGMRLERKAG